jgi:hypothetical protein
MAERYSSAQAVFELMLHEAAANGDERRIEELQIYLKRGKILINQPDVEWGNRTALHCAAERGGCTYNGLRRCVCTHGLLDCIV